MNELFAVGFTSNFQTGLAQKLLNREERFDRVTRLAKRIFGVSILSSSLIDADRQWFKSCIGLDAAARSPI